MKINRLVWRCLSRIVYAEQAGYMENLLHYNWNWRDGDCDGMISVVPMSYPKK
jgi:hypothetical protein